MPQTKDILAVTITAFDVKGMLDNKLWRVEAMVMSGSFLQVFSPRPTPSRNL
jgi:hypothetical protein